MDIEVQADDLRYTVDTVLGLIAEDTGQPVERIFDDSLHDHWYTAAEAKRVRVHRRDRGDVRPGHAGSEAAGRASGGGIMSSYTIPNVIAQHPRGDRIMDVYSHLLTERIVYLGTAIDPGVANALIAQLMHLEAESAEQEINLYINCEGGDLPSMLAVYDTMQYIEASVATTCVGQAIGVGAVLLAAGSPGRRALLPHARVVLHQPAGRGQGPIPDLILQADELVRMRAEIEAILSRHTGQTVQTLRTDTDRDRVLTAQAALEYGIVDQVLGQRLRDDAEAGPSAGPDPGVSGRPRRAAGRLARPWQARPAGSGGEGEQDRAGRPGRSRGRGLLAAQVGGHLLGQAGKRGAQGTGQGRDHLARGFLAAALDLGQVLRRDPGPACRLRERLVLVLAEGPQALASTSRHNGSWGCGCAGGCRRNGRTFARSAMN